VSGAVETFPPPRSWKIEFFGQTGVVQISGTVVRIHPNHVLNIDVKKFGKFEIGGVRETYVNFVYELQYNIFN